jgi:hypothetical protein
VRPGSARTGGPNGPERLSGPEAVDAVCFERAVAGAREAPDEPSRVAILGVIEAGPLGSGARPARGYRRPAVLAVGALVVAMVVVSVLVGMGVKSSGGGSALVAIPGDAVGALSLPTGRSGPWRRWGPLRHRLVEWTVRCG